MTKAYIRVKGDPSVGINHQDFIVDGLEFDDSDHREDCYRLLMHCFGCITGEIAKNITIRFDDDIMSEEARLDKPCWVIRGLTDTYENEQRN